MAPVVRVLPAPAPVSALTIGVTGRGLAVVAFGERVPVVARLAEGVAPAAPEDPGPAPSGDAEVLADAWTTHLAEYLAGHRRAFDLPLDRRLTTGVRRRVLDALYDTVPYGTTVTYGELARRAGVPSPRGIGSIMGSNPLPVVVPCHRVLGADGLGGFGGGRAVKEWLLGLEGVLPVALELG